MPAEQSDTTKGNVTICHPDRFKAVVAGCLVECRRSHSVTLREVLLQTAQLGLRLPDPTPKLWLESRLTWLDWVSGEAWEGGP